MNNMEQTIQEKRKILKDAIGTNGGFIKFIDVQKVYKTWEELHQSPEWIEMWSGWQGQSGRERINKMSILKNAFIIDDRIYAEYTIDEGITLFNEKTVHTCLSNAGFHEFTFIENLMLIMISKKNYENCPSNRKLFKQRNIYVTTEYFSYEEPQI